MPDDIVVPPEGQPDAATLAAQAAVDAETARLAAEQVVPEQYEYTLPEGLAADAAIVERTSAIARDLGLGNDAAQKLLEKGVASEKEATEQREAIIASWQKGGSEYVKRDETWKAQALADKDLGAGDAAKFAVHVEKAQQALAKYGPELKSYLDETGLGSHPAAIKFLSRVGAAMSEGAAVIGSIGSTPKPKSDAETLYPAHYDTNKSA
ncbi:MAG: hypothetical protein JWL61_4995 [Gemmatimonadetes bacterium]|nr:hypothetical protein [Gemmatimonadota bacterium]